MNDLLKKAIEQELIQKPKKSFANEVMNQVFELKKAREYTPIISRKTWVILLSFLVIFVVVLLVFAQPTVTVSENSNVYHEVGKWLTDFQMKGTPWLSHINFLPISLVSLAVFLLMVFDTRILSKSKQ